MITTNDANESTDIWINGRRYYGIEKISLSDNHPEFVIKVYMVPPDGDSFRSGFLMCPPVSPREYRKQHPTRARAEITSTNSLIIYDDWGTPTSITMTNRQIFDRLVNELGKANLITSVLGYSRQQILDAFGVNAKQLGELVL